MISKWLIGIFGTIGTAAILLVVAFAYFIWQFNPTFQVSGGKQVSVSGEHEANDPADNNQSVIAGKTINEKYAEAGMGNSLKGGAGMIDLTINDAAKLHDLKMVEKDDPTRESLERDELSIENEMVSDMLHKYEELRPGTTEQPKKDSETRAGKKTAGNTPGIDLELEINTTPLNEEDETETDQRIADLPPYEPTLDLKNYKYPGLDLLETHGSEKIIQDPARVGK